MLAVAVALSVLLHAAAVFDWWPSLPRVTPVVNDSAGEPAPLIARLTAVRREPEPGPAAAPPRRVMTESKPRSPVLAAERSSPLPPIVPERSMPTPALAPDSQTTAPPEPPAPPPPATAPITPPVAQTYADLSSYIAAKRRARGEPETGSASPADDEDARRNKIVAANLASIHAPALGEQRNTGGMFQITQLNAESAEFTFFGWNPDIRRRASQRIEVRRAHHGDIRVAVVRRMIAIIREYEQEDFIWRSSRLGRDVTLSARAADNELLEQFMLHEFFDLRRTSG